MSPMTDDQIREAIRVIRGHLANVRARCSCPMCNTPQPEDLLASYAEAQMGRRCENCRHRDAKHNECRLLEKGGYDDAYMQQRTEHHDCDELKFCGAFDPKEDTP